MCLQRGSIGALYLVDKMADLRDCHSGLQSMLKDHSSSAATWRLSLVLLHLLRCPDFVGVCLQLSGFTTAAALHSSSSLSGSGSLLRGS